jgi:SH3 domain protein
MSDRRTYLWLGLLLTLPLAATAETGYIIDNVEVGLYESADAASPIMKLLPTGTELEILASDGNLVQVRDPDGMTGWIDQRYLMGAKPTRQLLNEAEADLARLRAELDTVREQLAAPAASSTGADTDKLGQLRDKLQAELSAERQRVSELKTQLANQRRTLENSITDNGTAEQDVVASYFNSTRDLWIALAIVFLIGLALGIYLLDYFNRRRHGGFRV